MRVLNTRLTILVGFIASTVMILGSGVTLGAEPGQVSVRLGDRVSLVLTRDEGGNASSRIVNSVPKGDPVVTLHFTKEKSMRMLAIQNGYPHVLHFEAQICRDKGTRCAKTTILPVRPGLSSFESWGDPIDLLLISDFTLQDPKAH